MLRRVVGILLALLILVGCTGESQSGAAVEMIRVEAPPADPPGAGPPAVEAQGIGGPIESNAAALRLVNGLSFDAYTSGIETLASFGHRRQGSESFDSAAEWLTARLASAGYEVQHHDYVYRSESRQNVYVTKIGTTAPDRMYIVSAHLDGLILGNPAAASTDGGAADDDASGSALILEAALAFAPIEVQTDTSIRFVFWNNEETGLFGSRAYVSDRRELQGLEDPIGSGLYPEPTWLGMIQHDMLLYDHGVPPGPDQIDMADLDIEYRGDSEFATEAMSLAEHWRTSSSKYSSDYPAEVGDDMRGTDSVAFQNDVAAISIRENKRSELEARSNPNWHRITDVYATYSDADFRLGFNALQMTVGALAELAGATISD